MNTATDTERATTLIEIAQIAPSPTNPRIHYPPEKGKELQESIARDGVVVPILVRPHPKPKGAIAYEIVFGERRWLAAKAIGMAQIRAEVRDLDDETAERVQMIENLQREDLTPLDEAAGYDRIAKQGHSPTMIATMVGKRPDYVAARLQLVKLPALAKKALADGTMLLGVAMLIARIPTDEQRVQAAKAINNYFRGEDGPVSVAAASTMLEREFMLELGRAPFDVDDATLVAKAGSCAACPKRTGNQTLLFPGEAGDVCLDRACYRIKVTAHSTRLLTTAKAQGQEVIRGDAAKKLMPWAHSEITGYVQLDKEIWNGQKHVTPRKMLGKELPPVTLFEDPHSKTVLELISRKDLPQQLKRDRASSSHNSGGAAARRKARIDVAQRQEIHRQLHAAMAKVKVTSLGTVDFQMIAAAAYGELNFDMKKAVANAWYPIDRKAKLSVHEQSTKHIDALERRITSMNSLELSRILVDVTVARDLMGSNWGDDDLDVFAKRFGVDAKKARAQVAATFEKKAKKVKA